LAGVVGSTEARPTKQSVVVYDTLSKELEVYLVELRKAYKELLPPIDEILKKHGLPAIEVKAGDVQTPRRIGAEEETTGV